VAGFKAAFVNETVKLLKKKKLIAAAVLSVLGVLIGQAAVTAIQSGFGLRIAGSTEFPLLVLPVFTYTILPLFSTFVAIDMFNGEFNAGTMKLTLTRPVSRFGVFSAKVGNIAAFILLNLLFIMLVALIAGFIFNPSSTGLAGVLRVILAYVVTFVPIFVFSLLVVLLCNLIRSGLAVFFLSVLLFVGFIALGIIYSRISSFLFTSQLGWYTLWISDPVNISKLIRQTLLLTGFGIMLYTAGYYVFDRKDL